MRELEEPALRDIQKKQSDETDETAERGSLMKKPARHDNQTEQPDTTGR